MKTKVAPQRWYVAQFAATRMPPELDRTAFVVYTEHIGGRQVLLQEKPVYYVERSDGGMMSTRCRTATFYKLKYALAFVAEEVRIFLEE